MTIKEFNCGDIVALPPREILEKSPYPSLTLLPIAIVQYGMNVEKKLSLRNCIFN